MHEGIPILNYLVPKEFVVRDGKLSGLTFEKVRAVYDDKVRALFSNTLKSVTRGARDSLGKARCRRNDVRSCGSAT